MKKITSILVVCLLCVATTMSAQFTNSSSSNVSQSSDTDGWLGIRVSYSPMNIEMDDLKKDMTGFSAGFVKGFSLSSQSPIFAEIGANFQYLKSNLLNEDYGGDRLKLDLNMYSVNIPLNIGYKYAINEGFSIFPYAGISARGNISGKLVASLGSEEESVDIFDKDEMEDLEFKTFKRLQIGWQIGFGVNFNRLYLSASYGGDFNEVAEELKLSTAPSITLGINF